MDLVSGAGTLELLRAHLRRAGLVLCHHNGSMLDAPDEAAALLEIAELANDAATTPDIDDWVESSTAEIPAETIDQLRAQTRHAA